jgi:hypothetical protein
VTPPLAVLPEIAKSKPNPPAEFTTQAVVEHVQVLSIRQRFHLPQSMIVFFPLAGFVCEHWPLISDPPQLGRQLHPPQGRQLLLQSTGGVCNAHHPAHNSELEMPNRSRSAEEIPLSIE